MCLKELYTLYKNILKQVMINRYLHIRNKPTYLFIFLTVLMTTKSIQNTISAAKYVHQEKAEVLYNTTKKSLNEDRFDYF